MQDVLAMSVSICTECLRTSVDAMQPGLCFDGQPHDWVEAAVTDCPHARRDARGTIRHQWRREANQTCQDGAHHPLLAQHVVVPAPPMTERIPKEAENE